MSVDFRKLKSFVKIVDTGSVSRAAAILRTAQPALSQQIASLETHFKHKLLIRSNVGIAPTEAGLILYRHAQLMLKQLDQAQIDIDQAAKSVAGRVSIGLATYSTSSALSLPLLKEMRARHPHIVLHVNDSFGHILSELIMTGKMDMALIYAADPIKGVTLQPLFREEMFLVSPPGTRFAVESSRPLPLSALQEVPLLLPSKAHLLRRLIDDALARARVSPEVISEIESVPALSAAVLDGLGSTILPASVVTETSGFAGAEVRALTKPVIDATISLCVSDHLPLSEPAIAARSVLLEIVSRLMGSHHQGIRPV
ncbi:nitrogen assimilation transcriptional regulator [Agrobacterium tumefaciens]|uniref:nitrogen assimilation transcriptional regulator NAC n=1 Tax=Agrobacterium tumefaciens TaxID=358 RepID=UPI0015736858|nr:nitrogen assimilation transcriptional regulator NAC [Agrobacterium tumefaciens]NSY99557.1 nitrogen assimilation transcriptional regulator [Agrobacterium tumefaciens]NSZ36310.1 nitrogen assimilation transcriptional regulator [Agrobacterium tumefaciens]NTB21826.1 nitrogen assimilation transcriptional regulator [Agrobacterium tumefaciens]NTB31828.1 nitrogen assimilation transcriptional regulator [Agrobacterium tumefaciens]NTB32195.1 nitrogen assimilation transcriptional regulator [Agrobacteriu